MRRVKWGLGEVWFLFLKSLNLMLNVVKEYVEFNERGDMGC